MSNKKELILIVSLAFCVGVIFSDFTKPKPLEAEVTNIVYDTLDKKIIGLAAQLDDVRKRVSELEATNKSKDVQITKLNNAVKQLTSLQKDVSTTINTLKVDVQKLKDIQSLQRDLIK